MTKRTNYFMSSLCLISQIPNITTQLEKQIAFFEKPFTLVAKILHRNILLLPTCQRDTL